MQKPSGIKTISIINRGATYNIQKQLNGGRGMNPKILKWIENEQLGKSGIYPHKLAERAAYHFNIKVNDAVKYVSKHISNVLAEKESE